MAIEIGGKSLIGDEDANLNIPQNTSLYFTVVHKDDQGHAIDHSGSSIAMKFQTPDKATTYDMSEYCSATAECITVNIPASATVDLPVGKKSLNWDMIVTTQAGGQPRLLQGVVRVYDTYAKDEAE